jgi:hypothetical protein
MYECWYTFAMFKAFYQGPSDMISVLNLYCFIIYMSFVSICKVYYLLLC